MLYNANLTIIVPAVLAFIATVLATDFLMTYFYDAGVIAEDRNKSRPTYVPSSGGVAVALGIIIGILAYTFGGSFIFTPILRIDDLLAVGLSILMITLVGFIDDINVKTRRVAATGMKDIRKGLKQWQKPLLTFLGALPLMAINAGAHSLNVPFVGLVNLGVVYPIIIIPLLVIFVSNAVNLLGGFDGLQPGMTLVASLGILVYEVFYGNYIGIVISAMLFTSILAFLPFNLYKSRIIPGDSFTYSVGGTLVAIMVMGNAETFGAIIFIPWIAEFLLHLRRKFRVTDLGIRQKDGTLRAPYGRSIYSLTHLVMNMKKASETDVAKYLVALEAVFVVLGLALKFSGLL